MDGNTLLKMTQETFQTENVTTEQLNYVLDMLTPSTYLLRNHKVRNHNITFSIANKSTEKAQAHRPWQPKIINDSHPNVAVIKSRQLGLKLAPL
ncbi:terminase large subunit [Listeria phage vB_LmoM_AG20]|uniref:Putative terminase, small subunit n=1 Tax=Listeria phage vB_LmoM_AG20 TaxID=1168744 RepID=M4H0W1_9CAUD|nr:terminase large subunit [Listeria phage vB_LmoM_AG20]AFJ76001.1 putative terminase, small subunit [Listeria phage vB_LmoM_AG20]WIW77303.1 hypothetical protein CKA15_092 [Listeria phage cka15]